ncbi:hypothetical protein, partial [Staphylococcus aureus]
TALTLPSLARAQEIASARVGSASLKILTDGGITLPASMLARGVPPAEVRAALTQAGLSAEVTQSALNVPIVNLGGE